MNKGMEDLLGLMQTAEKAGINSIRKLLYFIEFADNQGKSMAELAGKAKTQEYNEIQQAVIELPWIQRRFKADAKHHPTEQIKPTYQEAGTNYCATGYA